MRIRIDWGKKNNSQSSTDNPDEFAFLAATWILASNDENPMITYKGIRYRLGLPEGYDIEGLIRKHGELFRHSVPKPRLEDWQTFMRLGRNMPGWIKIIKDETSRLQAIDALTPDNIFRSQFRAEKSAPKSPVEIIDWGLQHIERLRKANLEFNEQVAKRSEVIAAIGLGIINFFVVVVNLIFTLTRNQ